MRFGRPLLLMAAVAVLGGCGSSEPPVPTYLFFGTATSTTVDAGGATVHIRLVSQGGLLSDTPLYLARCEMVGPDCEFQINQVAEGHYAVYGVVDIDGDAERTDPLPSTGDLFSPARPLTMFDRQQMDFPDDAWRISP